MIEYAICYTSATMKHSFRLTEEAQVIARGLLRRHEQVCGSFEVYKPEDVTDAMINQSVIAYGVLCDRAGVPFLTHGVGHFPGEIAKWCDENSWPPSHSKNIQQPTLSEDRRAERCLQTFLDESLIMTSLANFMRIAGGLDQSRRRRKRDQ